MDNLMSYSPRDYPLLNSESEVTLALREISGLNALGLDLFLILFYWEILYNKVRIFIVNYGTPR